MTVHPGTPNPSDSANIRDVFIEDQMGTSYLNYSMSVIVGRALPDIRDGLKPVHRRIIYGMHEAGYTKRYVKCARTVGDVMGKYHPHGDTAIYDTMVRLAQPWAMGSVLIDGQGNFGSLDGDSAAAMRYTEARLSRLAMTMTQDIDEDTVDWADNYDNSEKEPTVLPLRFPNLLVNGQQGIAVGMATNMPPHNLGEAIDASLLVLDNDATSLDEILAVMPGPDFPTKGVIMGVGGIRQAYETGRGSIRISGVAEIESMKGGRSRIVVSELPFGVNKANFQTKIAELNHRKEIDGVINVRDESDRKDGVRVVVELRRDVEPSIVLNALKKRTDLVTSFGVNTTVINSRGNPGLVSVLQVLREFIAFRRNVVRRRTVFNLNKTRDALFRQIGLYAAVSRVDEVVRTIRGSADAEEAKRKLLEMEFPTQGDLARFLSEADPDEEVSEIFKLNEIQVKAILEMRLQKLTGLELEEIAQTTKGHSEEIGRFMEILNDQSVLNNIIRNELLEVKAKFATPRLTEILPYDADEIDDEDLIERKDIVITITKSGYIKRTELSAYREQRRGGKGRNGMDTKDDDFITDTLVCTTKTPLVFFTDRGIAHSLKAYRLPEGAPAQRGRPLVNFMQLRQDESISAVIAMPENPDDLEGKSLVFTTSFGTIRRNDVKHFATINKGGKIAINLNDEHDQPRGRLVSVLMCQDEDDVAISTRKGLGTRFPVDSLRQFSGRKSVGVKAINLEDDNEVIGASVLKHIGFTAQEREAYQNRGKAVVKDADGNETEFVLSPERMAEMKASEQTLLTITELGLGKRTSAYEYRVTQRGGKGLAFANINKDTGALLATLVVSNDDGLVLVTDGGQVIRIPVKGIRRTSRPRRGVKMFDLPEGQKIVSVARIAAEDIDQDDS